MAVACIASRVAVCRHGRGYRGRSRGNCTTGRSAWEATTRPGAASKFQLPQGLGLRARQRDVSSTHKASPTSMASATVTIRTLFHCGPRLEAEGHTGDLSWFNHLWAEAYEFGEYETWLTFPPPWLPPMPPGPACWRSGSSGGTFSAYGAALPTF
jgi:hypothetical protein